MPISFIFSFTKNSCINNITNNSSISTKSSFHRNLHNSISKIHKHTSNGGSNTTFDKTVNINTFKVVVAAIILVVALIIILQHYE